jgi:hypothetical protein
MNVEVVHVGVIHFIIQNSLIDVRYFKSGVISIIKNFNT